MTEDKFSNKAIAHLLRSVAAAYLIKNENRFKIIAYDKAADAVEHLDREIKDVWEDGKLKEIPGIGSSIAEHLDEYFKKGFSKHLDWVLSGIPPAVFELMKIRTIGPKKAYKLVKSLKLTQPETVIADLKKAISENKVANIPSFGNKSQEDIRQAIELYEGQASKKERMPLPYAYSLAQEISNYLKKNPKVKRTDALGSLRRMVATIGDIDIAVEIASAKDADEVIRHFTKYPKTLRIENAGGKKASIIIAPNIGVDLRVQEKEGYGSMLQYFTGSKSHNIKLREFALRKGYSLSEYGVKKVSGSQKLMKFETEEALYSFFGMQYIPPEIREGTNEIELALKNKIPKLVELKEIKGDLHIHSSYDIKPSHDRGSNSYDEIVAKAEKLGYEYVGFTDHNPRFTGVSEEVINKIMKRRKQYIDDIFSTKKFERTKYFIGIEVDILPDGTIALPEKSIEYVDYLIAAIHSSFDMDKDSMTKRIIKALQYPKVRILCHPTGRLLGKRNEYEVDWDKIFSEVKKKDIALEINSWPQRLDLPDTIVRKALEKGVKMAINSDAHSNEEMELLFYGVEVAKRGWAKKNDIINTLSYSDFKKWLVR